jgi:hypothetical protein
MEAEMMPDHQLPAEKKYTGCLRIALIVICVALLTSGLTIWMARLFLFPKAFKPVQLSTGEQKVLQSKIAILTRTDARGDHKAPLKPERYAEKEADRIIHLTERELNGLLAHNTKLAKKLVIDLSDDLASAKLLIPLDPELPVFGGSTLKVTAGLELRYAGQKPVVIVRGISIWGVPLPNAWLGGIKNIDLVREFDPGKGFWHAFAAGVDDIRISEGELSIKLKE